MQLVVDSWNIIPFVPKHVLPVLLGSAPEALDEDSALPRKLNGVRFVLSATAEELQPVGFDGLLHLKLPDGITLGLLIRLEEVHAVDDDIPVVVEDFFAVF